MSTAQAMSEAHHAPDLQDYAGRIALVTGALGAIGAATCEALRRRGARVVAADASAPLAEVGADLTRSQGVRLDVTDAASIRALVDAILKSVGPIDTLVNVAGVVSFGAAATLPEPEWDRVIDINLKGTFLACQAVMPAMKQARFGRIVNIGSVVGKNAGNARAWLDPAELDRAGNVAYGVSKAGVHVMTGFLAKELAAFGVTVNAVAPGPIATAMTTQFPDNLRALIPVGRMGTPDDVARAIAFLASRDSGFINGEVLDVNGGIVCD
jgi:NAD(P)-dependent dehydrogenase (short-subunit alcohol dehydrogenase family)